MPTPTWTPMATITLGSAASSVTFSNIPNTYRDLILIIMARSTSSDSNVRLRFNSDSTNSYAYVRMYGNGSTTASDSTTESGLQVARLTQFNSSDYGTGINHIMDYSATDKHKTVISRTGVASSIVFANAGRWASTSAVSSITLTSFESGQTFGTNSTFALYGVIA